MLLSGRNRIERLKSPTKSINEANFSDQIQSAGSGSGHDISNFACTKRLFQLRKYMTIQSRPEISGTICRAAIRISRYIQERIVIDEEFMPNSEVLGWGLTCVFLF